jgi:hypothetical protein
MKRLFNALDITDHDEVLYEMSLKEKEHEVYFYKKIDSNRWLPFFEKIFSWGNKSKNDIDLEQGFKIENTNKYCEHFGEK